MQITVFGASGNVGKLVVERLVNDGHTVKAFVHSRHPFEKSQRIIIIKGDVHNPTDVSGALEGSQAVICVLGSWHSKTKDILSAAMISVVPAMKTQGIERIITLTGADAQLSTDSSLLFRTLTHLFFKTIAPKVMQDSELHMQLLQKSQLDWTVIRSPIMRSRGKSSQYGAGAKPSLPWQTVHRRDVAIAIVDQLIDKRFYQDAPYLRQKLEP